MQASRRLAMSFSCPPELLLRTALRKDKLNRIQPCLTSGNQSRTYKAAVCTELGAPMVIRDMPSNTQLGNHDVKVNVEYAAVNFADILAAKGLYQEKRNVPYIPGVEAAGKIAQVGESVKHLKPGDSVIVTGNPCMSQEVVVHANSVISVPTAVDMAHAAAVICTYATAYVALKYKADLKEGETVLVTAAAGGVGLAAVDLAANLFKAKVIGAVGSDDKRAIAKQYGAIDTINYRTENVRSRIKEMTAKKGVNVVFEVVGGNVAEQALYSMAFEGRYLVIGFASGVIPKLSANLLLLKSCSAVGLYWGSYKTRKPALMQESIEFVVQALADGVIKPHISRVFPLDQVNEAFSYVEERKSTGKVLILLQ